MRLLIIQIKYHISTSKEGIAQNGKRIRPHDAQLAVGVIRGSWRIVDQLSQRDVDRDAVEEKVYCLCTLHFATEHEPWVTCAAAQLSCTQLCVNCLGKRGWQKDEGCTGVE
jgi:hypothetical protein